MGIVWNAAFLQSIMFITVPKRKKKKKRTGRVCKP